MSATSLMVLSSCVFGRTTCLNEIFAQFRYSASTILARPAQQWVREVLEVPTHSLQVKSRHFARPTSLRLHTLSSLTFRKSLKVRRNHSDRGGGIVSSQQIKSTGSAMLE